MVPVKMVFGVSVKFLAAIGMSEENRTVQIFISNSHFHLL